MANSGRQMANQARARALEARERGLRRKEEFLGARVPKELRDKVIKRAESEGIPVSILIRKILEHAFADEHDTQPSAAGVHSATSGTRSGSARFPNVLGWETISLHQRVLCSECGTPLSAGQKAVVGFSTTGGAPVTLCQECHASVSRG